MEAVASGSSDSLVLWATNHLALWAPVSRTGVRSRKAEWVAYMWWLSGHQLTVIY